MTPAFLAVLSGPVEPRSLESIPTSEDDIQLYEEKIPVEGAEESQSQGESLRSLEKENQAKSLVSLGWPRWKKVFVR